jgi:hypothetical protein
MVFHLCLQENVGKLSLYERKKLFFNKKQIDLLNSAASARDNSFCGK